MAIIRTKRPNSFTVINNDLINDARIDWRELGLLTYLLSKPDNWEVSVAHLQKVRESGRDAIYKSLKKLMVAGYVTGTPIKQGGFNYEVFDTPVTMPLTEKPLTEKPLTEKPLTENPPQVNTDSLTKTDNSVNTENIVITPPLEKVGVFVPADECELEIEKMGSELQECFEWAKEHEFWNFVARESIRKFLKLYSSKKPDGLRAQFERRNDVKPKQQGGDYENKHDRFTKPGYYDDMANDGSF